MSKQDQTKPNYDIQVPPIRHYPLWRYWCPKCESPWEGELRRENYFVPCPNCYEKGDTDGAKDLPGSRTEAT